MSNRLLDKYNLLMNFSIPDFAYFMFVTSVFLLLHLFTLLPLNNGFKYLYHIERCAMSINFVNFAVH